LIRLTASLLALSILPALAGPPQPLVLNAIPDRYRPLALDQQKLVGILSDRMRAAKEGYLEHVSDKALLVPFSSASGPAGNLTSSRGVQAEKFLSAAAIAYEYSRDPELKGIMDRVAKELMSSQIQDDYHSTNSDFGACRSELLGLLAYYRATGNEDALAASRKIGDLIVSNSGKRSSNANEFPTALLEPLVYLYSYTGDSRYLNLGKSLADSWLQLRPTRTDPSFENLTNLIGLVELYRITGDQKYFRPAAATWDDLRANRLTLTGAPSVAESEGSSGEHKSIMDVCASAAWVQLTLDLLRITGQSRYGDQLEQTIYNQLFASQDSRTGDVFSSAPLNGDKKPAAIADPCASAEAQGISLIPAAVWGRSGNGIAIILYSAGRAVFQLRRRGTVQLYSETTYPETGGILLHVEPAHPIQFPLRLRVPEWTTNFVVDIGASHLIGKPGEYLTITRQWKRGDTVKIAMNIAVKLIDGTMEHAGYIAIRRGPQVLALSKPLNPGMDLAMAALRSTDPLQLRVPPGRRGFPASWAGSQIFTFPGEYNGKPQELVLVPFADATSYRVWMRNPSAASGGTDH
jgi:uncharacterized protein